MAYFIDADGNYPRHLGDILTVDEHYIEGGDLPEGWLEVAEGVLPECAVGETYAEVEPTVVAGVLTRQFIVVAVEPPVVVEDPYPGRPEPLLLTDSNTNE